MVFGFFSNGRSGEHLLLDAAKEQLLMRHILFSCFLSALVLSPCAFAKGRDYSGWQSASSWVKSIAHSPSRGCVRYCDLIAKYATRHQLPEALLVALISQESNFNASAVSTKGAKGLMQLMDINSQGIDPFHPEQNLERGTQLLARLVRKFGDLRLALAAYNAGEGNVKKYGGIPPFKETQNYVNVVLRKYRANL